MSRRSWFFLSVALGLPFVGPARARAQTTSINGVVQLPPFIVEDATSPLHWRYAAVKGFQVLSLCPDETTQGFIGQLFSLETQLNWLLPMKYRYQTSVPVTMILCDDKMRSRLDADMPVEMYLAQNGQAPSRSAAPIPRSRFATVPNLRLEDTDSYMIFALLDSQYLRLNQLDYHLDYMALLLQQRTPPLPAWFTAGFLHLYQSMIFEPVGPVPPNERPPLWGRLRVVMMPFVWISAEQTQALRLAHGPARPPAKPPADAPDKAGKKQPDSPLLPMEDVLVAPHRPAGSAEAVQAYDRTWICQAALLVRWALDARNPGGQAALWRFLDRSQAAAPVSKRCSKTALGWATRPCAAKLTQYLYTTSAQALRQSFGGTDLPPVELRDATRIEVAQIKGDWERLETAFVKKTYPALSASYLEHAQRTLWQGYDLGDRDPRLLAAMGLYECDAGDDAAAQPLLTAATASQVIHPRAYFELARILYAQATAAPLGANHKLSAAQAAAVLTPSRRRGSNCPRCWRPASFSPTSGSTPTSPPPGRIWPSSKQRPSSSRAIQTWSSRLLSSTPKPGSSPRRAGSSTAACRMSPTTRDGPGSFSCKRSWPAPRLQNKRLGRLA